MPAALIFRLLGIPPEPVDVGPTVVPVPSPYPLMDLLLPPFSGGNDAILFSFLFIPINHIQLIDRLGW